MFTLDDAIEEATATASGWWRARCPFCAEEKGVLPRSKNLALRMDTGYYQCWSCGERGNFDAEAFPDQRQKAENWATHQKMAAQFELPADFIPCASNPIGPLAKVSQASAVYMLRRGVPMAVAQECNIGVAGAEWSGRVIIPVYTNGVLMGWSARNLPHKNTGPRYKYPTGMRRGEVAFNMDALQEETIQPVLIVEGVMDALPHWPHAVAVLGKPSEAHLGLLAAAKRPVVMCLDADAWRTGVGVMQRLRLRGVEAHYLELPPGRDPGEMTTEDLLSRAHELCAK